MNVTALRAIIAGTFVTALATAAVAAQSAAPPGDAKRGRELYVVQGCYECHGYQGQGSGSRTGRQNPGPNLAPAPIPVAAFLKQLRAPRAVMPPYDARLLSERDVADIYAYLAAQPPAKDPHRIALLAGVTTGNGAGTVTAPSRGEEVYAANCAACHGASGRGGTGPPLIGEKSRKDAGAAIAFVKNPPPPMPKLYPGVLTDADVAAVVAYVESLR